MFGEKISTVSESLSPSELNAVEVDHNIGQNLHLSSVDVCQRVQTFIQRDTMATDGVTRSL